MRPNRWTCGSLAPVRGLCPSPSGTPRLRRPDGLHVREEILIFRHGFSCGSYFSGHWAQIGRFSHQPHHSGQPRVQNGPLMTMHTALKNTAASARNRPRRWMPSVPIE